VSANNLKGIPSYCETAAVDNSPLARSAAALKNQSSDPSKVPPATMAKDVVRYLASAQAAAELREMGAGQAQGEETGEAESDTTGQ
jgi:hypothetical protein